MPAAVAPKAREAVGQNTAAQGWQTLAVRDEPLSSIAFGDFDGDGATDVFRTGCL